MRNFTQEEAREFGRRMFEMWQNKDGLEGVLVNGGFFPLDLPTRVEEVMESVAYDRDEVAIAVQDDPMDLDLNEGFTDSPVQFSWIEDGLISAACRVPAGQRASAQKTTVNVQTGAVTYNGEVRTLPAGINFVRRTNTPYVEDGCIVLNLVVNVDHDVQVPDFDNEEDDAGY